MYYITIRVAKCIHIAHAKLSIIDRRTLNNFAERVNRYASNYYPLIKHLFLS